VKCGKIMKVKTDTINMWFVLIAGVFLMVLGLIYSGVYLGFYGMGLAYMFWSLAFTKYKAYAKYIVPTLLSGGTIIATLGWCLLRMNPRMFMTMTGIGIFAGGIVILIAVSLRRKLSPSYTVL
jgi:hypothetical protein